MFNHEQLTWLWSFLVVLVMNNGKSTTPETIECVEMAKGIIETIDNILLRGG